MELEVFIEEISNRIVKYLRAGDEPGKVADPLPHTSLSKITDLKLPIEGNGMNAVLDDIDTYLRSCVNTNRPGFMNPLWGGINTAGLAGEIIATLTNTSMYTYELAPLATLIEQTLLIRMGEMVGFSGGAGTLTTGGSNGNMLGMLCARQVMVPTSTQTGFDGRTMVAYVSSESHYSVLMSANVIGIGHQNIIKVACDEDGCMHPSALEEEIQRTRREGGVPFCVISTAGTTVRGSFDPIKEISDIALKEGIWHHVDAAWGGSALFSSKHGSLLDGVESADSVCWDAHKMMGLPLICSAFLVKQPEILARVCAHGNVAHYLFHEESRNIDAGRYSLQCGRRNDALKLWLAWRECGDAGWASMVDRYMDLAGYLESQVLAHDDLELMSSRMWTNVCFRFSPEDYDGDLNELNSEVRRRMMQNGNYMVSRSNIGDDVIFRAVISNPKISEHSLDELLNELTLLYNDVIRGLPSEHGASSS
jgi:glutamate/tyrosine decarboxylase-like PLP-dependent enzyme